MLKNQGFCSDLLIKIRKVCDTTKCSDCFCDSVHGCILNVSPCSWTDDDIKKIIDGYYKYIRGENDER